jgi:hypothetical protein
MSFEMRAGFCLPRDRAESLASRGQRLGQAQAPLKFPFVPRRYPDVFDGRHVRVHPLSDGTVRVERVPAGRDPQRTVSWTLPLEDAGKKIQELLAEL